MGFGNEFVPLTGTEAIRRYKSPSNQATFFHYLAYSSRMLPQTHTKFLQENGCSSELYDVQSMGRDTDYADLTSCFLLKVCQNQYVNWNRKLRALGGEGAEEEMYELAKCWENKSGTGIVNEYSKFTEYLDDVRGAPF